MFITHKKDLKIDGTNPTLLYGYGGFDISEVPRFRLDVHRIARDAAAFTRPRTCAAAASTAKRGTRPGSSQEAERVR